MSKPNHEDICGTCGSTWGQHIGTLCPGGRGGKWTPSETIESKVPKAWKITLEGGGPTVREWLLVEPDEVLELANKIYEAMVVRENIPKNNRPKMVLILEVHDGKGN